MTSFKTTKGLISGELKNGVYSFKGVPYAKPPVDQLRFAPPQEMDSWSDVKNCTEFGPCAVQAESILINNKTSEDCLYLNIWTPENPENKKLPVFFWVHGGGYFTGCGSMNYYDGTPFAKKDIIVVTINYRLGALGFLGLETLYKEYNTTGNWGTLDQIAALKWTHENISNFGGDPDNITIAGESAGSFSISNLVMSPLTKGLFKRAIMESGSIFGNKMAVPYTESKLDKTIEMSRKYAATLGADDSKEGLEKLRQMDAMKLWETSYFSSDATEECPLAMWATLDGYVLPKDPIKALKNGDYNHGDFIIGYNHDEGIAFIPDGTNNERMDNYFKKFLSDEELNKAKDLFKDEEPNDVEVGREIVTYSYFKAGMTLMKNNLSEQGNNVYAYQFDFHPDGNYPMAYMGAHHAAEIPFVFGTSEIAGVQYSDTGKKVQEQMHTLWANFVKTGDPNKPDPLPINVPWKKYCEKEPNIYILDKNMICEEDKNQNRIDTFINMIYRNDL